MSRIYANLADLGIVLPSLRPPIANYVPFVQVGDVIYLSGQGPRASDGSWITGRVGQDLSIEQAYLHARTVGLGLLAAMEQAAHSLDNVKRIVKVFGMVNAVPGFNDHPTVINGCSDLLVEVFGEAGRHARSAVGMGSLPANIPVEIEAVIQVTAQ